MMLVSLLIYALLQLLVAPVVIATGLVQVKHLTELGDDYNCPG